MKYHCMIDAFAKAMRITPQELAEALPHDGKGTFPGTNIQRTHHVQEMLDVSSDFGLWFSPIELVPQSYDPYTRKVFQLYFGDGTVNANFQRFKSYLHASRGVIVGMRGEEGHSVYWDGRRCHDHLGCWELWGDDSDFAPGMYWRAVWIT